MVKQITTENILKDLSIILNDLAIQGNFIIGVFGSVARGTNTKRSDIDLMYKDELDFVTAGAIAAKLKDIYNVHVDVCSYTGAKEEDVKIDEIAIEITGEPNEDSVYKLMNREGIWLDRQLY